MEEKKILGEKAFEKFMEALSNNVIAGIDEFKEALFSEDKNTDNVKDLIGTAIKSFNNKRNLSDDDSKKLQDVCNLTLAQWESIIKSENTKTRLQNPFLSGMRANQRPGTFFVDRMPSGLEWVAQGRTSTPFILDAYKLFTDILKQNMANLEFTQRPAAKASNQPELPSHKAASPPASFVNRSATISSGQATEPSKAGPKWTETSSGQSTKSQKTTTELTKSEERELKTAAAMLESTTKLMENPEKNKKQLDACIRELTTKIRFLDGKNAGFENDQTIKEIRSVYEAALSRTRSYINDQIGKLEGKKDVNSKVTMNTYEKALKQIQPSVTNQETPGKK